MQHYVLGFAFSEDASRVAFIRKNRPAWQAGKLNGVGGKLETGETPVGAMRREFWEESGVDVPEDQWRHFAMLSGVDFCVWCFVTRAADLEAVHSATDEPLEVHYVTADRWQFQSISNLPALVHTALDPDAPFLSLTYRESADAMRAEFDAGAIPA